MPDYLVEGWFGVIGPEGIPPADAMRVHDAFKVAFDSEMSKYADLVKKASLELQ